MYNDFGKYLEILRVSRGAAVQDLSKGLCSHSLISKIVSGERLSTSSMRHYLIGRLGSTYEENDEYVGDSEFNTWQNKRKVSLLMTTRKNEEAQALLYALLNTSKTDRLLCQFCYGALAVLEKDPDKARFLLKKAIDETMEITENGFIKNKWLAPEEINLLTEYAMLLHSQERERIFKYLFDYLAKKEISPSCLVLMYPKLVFCYYKDKCMPCNLSSELFCHAIKDTDKAIRYLWDADRLYYLDELLKLQCDYFRLSAGVSIKPRINELPSEENAISWASFWTELKTDYCVSTGTDPLSFLDSTHPLHNISDIIKLRRSMLGLSRNDISESICSEKTIERIEKHICAPRKGLVFSLFDKLRLFTSASAEVLPTVSNLEHKHTGKTRLSEYHFTHAEVVCLYNTVIDLHGNVSENISAMCEMLFDMFCAGSDSVDIGKFEMIAPATIMILIKKKNYAAACSACDRLITAELIHGRTGLICYALSEKQKALVHLQSKGNADKKNIAHTDYYLSRLVSATTPAGA